MLEKMDRSLSTHPHYLSHKLANTSVRKSLTRDVKKNIIANLLKMHQLTKMCKIHILWYETGIPTFTLCWRGYVQSSWIP